MKIDELKNNPANPRKITDKKVSMLKKSMAEFGDLSCLITNSVTGHTISGHQRIKCLPKDTPIIWEKQYDVPSPRGTIAEGYIEIDGERFKIRRVEWDLERERAATIAANAVAGEWDKKILAEQLLWLDENEWDTECLGWDKTEFEDLCAPHRPKAEGNAPDDEVPPVPIVPKTKLGELWILGSHRLLCGDSTDSAQVLRLMNGEKADMVFTDPPYGVAVENTQGSIMGDEDLLAFKACLPVLRNATKVEAHFYIWCASGDRLPESIWEFAKVIPFQNLLPVRCTHENKRGPKGAFKLNYESCLFGNTNERTFNSSPRFPVSESTLHDPRYKGDGFLTVYPALWDGERATQHNMNIVHPTQKKVEMIEFYIEISSGSEDIVLDLFLGSGSTLIACEKTNRKCLGMEIDPIYCDVILDRWAKYTGKDPLREDGTKWSELSKS